MDFCNIITDIGNYFFFVLIYILSMPLLLVRLCHFLTSLICRLRTIKLFSEYLYGVLPLGPISMIRQQAICHCHCN